ncbi:MAG: ATP-dependent DNA ligase [Bryobacterales bacterium]|nr:ATP-dependent DNA ligase [Bryobacterales bacterium]
MNLPIEAPYPPMEAKTAAKLPAGDQWQFEPKWDGFRCITFRDGVEVELQSKAGQPLGRYFPELVHAFREVGPKRFVVDGEIMIPSGDGFSFDALLQRIHPAESRIRKLSVETPAIVVIFDLLVDSAAKLLTGERLEERRKRLEKFFPKYLQTGPFRLTPATRDRKEALEWANQTGSTLDGVIAKRIDLAYQSGERTGMVKVKKVRTADCVVGGFRYLTGQPVVGSLLLGLYGDDGLLDHVGFTSSMHRDERADITKRVRALEGGSGFTGKAPGGPSRWSTAKSAEWVALKPELVVEVQYDHFTQGRFRHGTKLLRWRPDKAPRQCTFDQVARSA